nr:MAG: hypothetical protein [Caudoviricetes sp.]
MAKKYFLQDYKEKAIKISENKVEDIEKIIDFIDNLWAKEDLKKLKKFLYFFKTNIQCGVFKNTVNNFLEYYSIKGKVTNRKMILKFGEVLGNSKWSGYVNKQKITNSFEYKNKKYGMTREEFEEYNKSRSVTLENLILRHGKIEGTKKFEDYCTKQKTSGCTLDYFVEKYGQDIGKKVYLDICKRKTHNLESYIYKYGKEGIIKYNDYLNKVSVKRTYSKMSQKFFWELVKILEENGLFVPEEIKFAENGGEKYLLSEQYGRGFFYDFCIEKIKLIIEFNGDLYHANPKKYLPNDIPPYRNNDLSAKQIWEHDKKKNDSIISSGYELLIVWEDDLKNDYNNLIYRIIGKINERIQYFENKRISN